VPSDRSFVNVFVFIIFVPGMFGVQPARAQSDARQTGAILKEEILSPQVALFQLREYILRHVVEPPRPASAEEWSAHAKRLREHMLNDVAFHGWPKEWVNAPPKFEDLGLLAKEKGYRLRKLRYEIVPGFYATAILYEPENIQGKIPAILNVNGHEVTQGKAAEYKQKRCITFARHGMLALSLEWLGMGQLNIKEHEHWFGAHLDLVGTHELGLFILAMRKGLDYLYEHPNVDHSRLGMTGLSGGGWQTVVLSGLDERITASAPVAGFSSIRPRLEVRWYGDLGDIEQSPTDAFKEADYPFLVAMRAPRPTLIIHNAEDDCCFRAPLVKQLNYDANRPIFRLFGKEDALGWHENTDPSTHNYQLDNRTQVYHFFSKAFNLPPFEEDVTSWSEIKSYDELSVELPKDNLSTLGLARKLAAQLSRPAIPSESATRPRWAGQERDKLRSLVKLNPVQMASPWGVAITKSKGVESTSYLFRMDNGLSADGVLLKAIVAPPGAPATIVLNDQGKKAAGADVSDRINRGEQVLALDLIFTGAAWEKNDPYAWEQFLHTVGDRALGIEVAQLVSISGWFAGRSAGNKVRLETRGIRSQVAALAAAALEPALFSEVVVHEGMKSPGYLLEKPVEFHEAADLFCLDFYKEFDLDRLAAIAQPVRITTERFVEDAGEEATDSHPS
jgi:dienelactone hydrolase